MRRYSQGCTQTGKQCINYKSCAYPAGGQSAGYVHNSAPEPHESSPCTPPHSTSRRSTIIFSSHPLLSLPSGLFPSDFPTKTPYTHFLLPIHATYPAHLILLNLITQTILGEQYRSVSSSLCSFLHSPVTSFLLGPNILLYTLQVLSNTLSLRSSLCVSGHVSYPYKTVVTIIILYILIFMFLDSKLKDKRFCTGWQQAFRDFNLLLIYSSIEFYISVAKHSSSWRGGQISGTSSRSYLEKALDVGRWIWHLYRIQRYCMVEMNNIQFFVNIYLA